MVKKKVCLFGLSGDPPTGKGGHVGIVQALVKLQRFDEVRVLPVYRHTFASKRDRLVSFEHRLKMCELAFGGIPTVRVSDDEYRSWLKANETKSQEEEMVTVGTASLLDYLYQVEPDSEFHFCLGADAFLDLTAGKWKESKRVLEYLKGKMLVLGRKSDKSNVESLLRQSIEKQPGTYLLQIDDLEAVSSSQVRACEDLGKLSGLVVPSVVAYMKTHKLYAFTDHV